MVSVTARRIIPVAILLLTAASAQRIEAAEPAPERPSEQEGPRGRELNGHVFMPAAGVPGALVTTSFMSGLIAGYGNTHATWDIGDRQLSGTFDYAGVGAVLGYEYAFTDNLSARVEASELIYSGITGRSAVVVGSRIQGGAGAGLTYSLPLGDSLRAGVRFDAQYTPNAGLTIGSAIKSVIDSCNGPEGCNLDSAHAFELKNVLTLQPALAANWAPTPALGLTGNVAFIYADQKLNGETFTGRAVSLGAAVDFDFGAISRVPLGLQMQFSWTAPSGEGLQHVTDLGGGIFYTGRKHLALGVQVVDRRFAVSPDVDVTWSTYLTTIGMRYYW